MKTYTLNSPERVWRMTPREWRRASHIFRGWPGTGVRRAGAGSVPSGPAKAPGSSFCGESRCRRVHLKSIALCTLACNAQCMPYKYSITPNLVAGLRGL